MLHDTLPSIIMTPSTDFSSPGESHKPPYPSPRHVQQQPPPYCPTRPTFRMLLALLPRLIIPKNLSPKPILLANPSRQPQMKRPVAYHRPSYQNRQPKPPPRPAIRLEEFDDIEVFTFYHPCLFPPPTIQHKPPSMGTLAAVKLPSDSREQSWSPAPSLRRSQHTINRKERSHRRRSKQATVPPSQPCLHCMPQPNEANRPLSPLPLRPRRVSLRPWAECNNIQPIAVPERFGRGKEGLDQEVNTSDDELTPYLRTPSSSEDETNLQEHHSPEQAALRELWVCLKGSWAPTEQD